MDDNDTYAGAIIQKAADAMMSMIRVAFVAVSFILVMVFIMVVPSQIKRAVEDNQQGFTGSPLLETVAPLGASLADGTQSLTSQLDRVAVTQNEVFMTVRWRAPSEYSKPEDSTEVAVLRVLMRRLSQLQESPAASDNKARALFKLMEAEAVLLGSELRGDMPSFPGIQ